MTIRLLAMGALCAGGLLCASSAPTVAQGIVLNLPWAKGDNIQRNRDGGRVGTSDIGAFESKRKKRGSYNGDFDGDGRRMKHKARADDGIREGGRRSKVNTNQGTGGNSIDVIQSGARIRF